MGKHIVQSKDTIWRRIGDDIVIIKDGGLSTHVLNKTAAFIWELCDGKSGVDEIAARICERFDVSYDEARADVDETVRILTKASVLRYS
jgi:hypothetical protein